MTPLIFTYSINSLLMIVLPIALGIYLTRRFRTGWVLFFSGGLTFIVSQIGHIPFNTFLTYLFRQGILPAPAETYRLAFNAVVLGLSAGLWEETIRYVSLRWWVGKDVRTWGKALVFGSGWGGIEAIILGVVALFAMYQMLAFRNADLTGVVPPEQLELARQQITAYWSAPWYTTLLGAYERIWAIVLQISLTVIVVQAVLRKQTRWLWLAIGWHALVDALAVYILGRWGAFPVDGVATLLGLVSLGFIFALRWPDPPEAVSEAEGPLPIPDAALLEELPEAQLEAEDVEGTRFQ